MTDIFKCYLFLGILLALITKFPLYSFQNFGIIMCFAIIMAIFKRSIEEDQMRKSLKETVKLLRLKGFDEDADKVEKLISEKKKSFIEKIKDDMEDDDGRF